MKALLLAAVVFAQGAIQPIPQSATIAGRILSQDGKPAVNVRVGAVSVLDAVQGADSAILSIAQTDNDGRYRLENVPPGRYYLTVGLVSTPTYFPGVADRAKATVVTVSERAAMVGFDFPVVTSLIPPVQPLQLLIGLPTGIVSAPAAVPMGPLVLRTIYLANVTTPQGMNDIVAALRVRLQLTRVVAVSVANAIVLRDTADKVALAENIIADLDKPTGGSPPKPPIPPSAALATDAAGNLSVIDSGRVRRVAVHSQLDLKNTKPISITLNENARLSYEKLAELAGLNVIFTSSFVTGAPIALDVESVGILDALDLLSRQTRTFWQGLNNNSIVVGPDNVQTHRDLDPQILKTFYLSNITTTQGMNEVVQALRTTLQLASVQPVPAVNALLLRDTPNKVAIAERLIADLDGQGRGATPAAPISSAPDLGSDLQYSNVFVFDACGAHIVTPKRAQVEVKTTGLLSIKMNENSRTSYEKLAEIAGINIVFDSAFQSASPIPVRFDNVSIFDALDLLSVRTGNFWQPLDSHTIIVASNNAQKHRELDTKVLKTIYLSNTLTPQEVNDITQALRTVVTLAGVVPNIRTNAIVMMDNPIKIALAEKIIGDTDKPKSGNLPAARIPPSADLGTDAAGNVFVLDAGRIRKVTPKRSQLDVKTTGPLSVAINGTAQSTYETLARVAGLNVVFAPQFIPGARISPFHVDNIEILDTLDTLSMVTATFWHVVDNKTILVAPNNATSHRDLDPIITKTFALTNATTQQAANDIVQALRTLVFATQIQLTPTNAIEIHDTEVKLALAEKIIADLDKPSVRP